RKDLVCFEATPPGFEPGQREPKSLVLPLHYGVMVTAEGNPADRWSLVSRQMDEEGQLLQLDGQVNRNEADAGWHMRDHGGEMQQAANAGGHQSIGYALGRFGWNGYEAEFGSGLGDYVPHHIRRMDRQSLQGLTDLAPIRIKQGNDAKTLLLKSSI